MLSERRRVASRQLVAIANSCRAISISPTAPRPALANDPPPPAAEVESRYQRESIAPEAGRGADVALARMRGWAVPSRPRMRPASSMPPAPGAFGSGNVDNDPFGHTAGAGQVAEVRERPCRRTRAPRRGLPAPATAGIACRTNGPVTVAR